MRPEDVDAALVEKAARAAYEIDERSVGTLDLHPWSDVIEDHKDAWRVMARHALAAVLPEIQAQALRDAAEFLDADYEKQRLARDQSSTYREGYLDGHERAGTLVARRAARLTAKTEEPTDA